MKKLHQDELFFITERVEAEMIASGELEPSSVAYMLCLHNVRGHD